MKKIIAVILTTIIYCTITGCSHHTDIPAEKEETSYFQNISKNNLIYNSEKIDIDNNFDNLGEIVNFKDDIFINAEYCFSKEDEIRYIYNINKNKVKNFHGIYDYILNLVCSGNIYYSYEYDKENDKYYICKYGDDTDTPEAITECGIGKLISYSNGVCFYNYEEFVTYDIELNITKKVESGEIDSEYRIVTDNDKNFIIFSYNKEKEIYTLKKLDTDGNEIFSTSDFNDLTASGSCNMSGLWISNNKIYVSVNSDESQNDTLLINSVDIKTGEIIDRLELDGFEAIKSNSEDYFYVKKITGLYKYHLDTNKYEKLDVESESYSLMANSEDWWIDKDGINFSGVSYIGYNGDSNVILRLNRDYDIQETIGGGKISEVYTDSKQIYILKENSLSETSNIISVSYSKDGKNFSENISFKTEHNVSNFWVHDNTYWIMCNNYLTDENKLMCYSTDGICIKEIDFPYSIVGQLNDDQKNIIFYINDDDNIVSAEITENGVTEIKNTKLNSSASLLKSDVENNFIYYDTAVNMLINYDMINEKGEILVDLSEYSIQRVMGVTRIDDSSFLISGIDENGISSLWKLSTTDKKQISSIKIAGVNIPNYYKNIINEFNSLKNDTQIEIEDYLKSEDDYYDGYNRLNKDIISGTVPDIILSDGSFNIQEHQKKDLFCDLTEIIDPDITLDCVKSAFLYNGTELIKVYPFLNNLEVIGIYNNSYTDENINLNKFLNYADENDTDHYSMDIWEEELLSIYLSEYIDIEKGSYNFNNETFIQLLDFLKQKYRENELELEFEENEETVKFVNFYTLINSEDIEYTVFHGVNNNELLSLSTVGISVYSRSEHKDVISEFLNYLLGEKIQASSDDYEYVFPVNKTELNKKIKSLIPNYINITDSKISEINSVFDAQMITDMKGTKVFEIVSDEIFKFCNDEATAQETADIIQKKLALYFAEV